MEIKGQGGSLSRKLLEHEVHQIVEGFLDTLKRHVRRCADRDPAHRRHECSQSPVKVYVARQPVGDFLFCLDGAGAVHDESLVGSALDRVEGAQRLREIYRQDPRLRVQLSVQTIL